MRLELVPLAAETLEALAADDRVRAAALTGIAMPDPWAARDRAHALRRLGQLRADPAAEPWLTRAIVERASGVMVGRMGFHAPPGDPELDPWIAAVTHGPASAVEIGYAVFAPYRRRGYAVEAATALIAWAAEQGVTHVVASVAPDNVASLAVIARLGFERVGERMDDIDGLEHVFMRDIRMPAPATRSAP